MGYRINERNIGSVTLNGELKRRIRPKGRKLTLSYEELQMAYYLLRQVSDNIELDATDMDNQVFRDNGNILIQFDRLDIQHLNTLIEKLK